MSPHWHFLLFRRKIQERNSDKPLPMIYLWSMKSTNIPKFFYGTAWKEERTAQLTFEALNAGFLAIDTANQRKHYFEAAVGEGLQKFLTENKKSRDEIFLQTKYTFARGQDHRKPYKDEDSFTQQVKDSFASSLQHLHTDFIDSYVLHGPYSHPDIGEVDLEVWQTMENLLSDKKVGCLGISNVSAQQLEKLCAQVKTKPKFVQNRCYARMGWDKQVREICESEKITYQGFSLLTANAAEIQTDLVVAVAKAHQKSIAQVIFRFSQQLGMITLTGTSNPAHMESDLDIEDFELSDSEMSQIEHIAF